MHGFRNAGNGSLVTKATLPNPQNRPPFAAKLRVNSAIALPIASDLCLPIPNMALRAFIASRTTVPEAAVYEESDLFPWPAKIGSSAYGALPAPTVKPVSPQKTHHFLLGALVSTGLHRRHVPRTSRLIDSIHRSTSEESSWGFRYLNQAGGKHVG